MPVIRSLVADGGYAVRVLTRDASSRRARELAALDPSRVELVEGSFTSEADLRAGYEDCYGAFVNIDGFAAGEKAETYWAIRAYELALEADSSKNGGGGGGGGLELFVYGNLDYGFKKGAVTTPASAAATTTERAGWASGSFGRTRSARNAASRRRRPGRPSSPRGLYMEMTMAAGTPNSPTVEEEVDETGEKVPVVTWRVPPDGRRGRAARVVRRLRTLRPLALRPPGPG